MKSSDKSDKVFGGAGCQTGIVPWGGVMQVAWNDPYKNSRLVERTAKTRHWSVMDLDGCYAAGSLQARRKVRNILEKKGALIYSTARSAELVMSTPVFELSRYAGGFERPAPKWRLNGKEQYEFVGLESLPEFECLIDPPDAIFNFGDNIHVGHGWCTRKNISLYVPDHEYERRYLDPAYYSRGDTARWRDKALELVKMIGAQSELASIEIDGAYEQGRANVAPLKYRIQLDMYGWDALYKKYHFLAKLLEEEAKWSTQGQIKGVDESRPDEVDPESNRATLYIVPPAATKEDMVNRGLLQTCRHARLDTRRMNIDIFGDALTDFASMCEAGYDAEVTGLVVGTRLAKCIEEKTNFAAVDLRHFHNALQPTDRSGVYRYENPHGRGANPAQRTIIVGSLAYPGTDGADTILAYLEDNTFAPAH